MKDKIIAIIGCSVFICVSTFGQQISNDGKLIAYHNAAWDVYVRSTISPWEKQVNGKIFNFSFTSDSKKLIYLRNDTLFILSTGSNEPVSLPDVSNFYLPKNPTDVSFFYTRKSRPKEVSIYNLNSRETTSYNNADSYTFNDQGDAAVITTGDKLVWLDLASTKPIVIWDDNKNQIKKQIFDKTGKQLAFIAAEKNNPKKSNSIWFYKEGREKAELLANNQSVGIDSNLMISDTTLTFTRPLGTKVLFYLQERDLPKIDPKLPKLDVWSYLDVRFQSQQLIDRNTLRKFAVVVSPENLHLTRIEYENDAIGEGSFVNNDHFFVVQHFNGDGIYNGGFHRTYFDAEMAWNKGKQIEYFLISTDDGSKKAIGKDIVTAGHPMTCSPDGKYLYWYDLRRQGLCSYNIAIGTLRNISNGVMLITEATNYVGGFYNNDLPLGWMKNDAAVFVYDKYHDIWKLDPMGKNAPVSLTNGYARKHQIEFQLFREGTTGWQNSGFGPDEDLMLLGEDMNNNLTGYCRVSINKSSDLIHLIPINYKIDIRQQGMMNVVGTDVYLLKPKEANFVYTRNFAHFTEIPDSKEIIIVNKRKFSKENIQWKAFDGVGLTGYFIKPANFNPHRRYAVLFGIYDDRPESAPPVDIGDSILFFQPRMHYTSFEHRSDDVYNCLGSAVNYISSLPYVNASKLGLMGTSFGGYQCYLAAVRLHSFAAIFASSGMTDLLSLWGGQEDDEQGKLHQEGPEHAQEGIGASPWERPDLYIKNSPIFYADRVTTPLLIAANKADNRVPYTQGLAFYKAMRRMGKPCWMLQGDGIGHSDYNHDMVNQFFRHYLLDQPAPFWMTRGVPARQKQIHPGMEYDTETRTPGPGLLMSEDSILRSPVQKELLKHRTTVDENGRIMDAKFKKK